jgi:hypothetical protein
MGRSSRLGAGLAGRTCRCGMPDMGSLMGELDDLKVLLS